MALKFDKAAPTLREEVCGGRWSESHTAHAKADAGLPFLSVCFTVAMVKPILTHLGILSKITLEHHHQ